jgi:hypothetical protein
MLSAEAFFQCLAAEHLQRATFLERCSASAFADRNYASAHRFSARAEAELASAALAEQNAVRPPTPVSP